MLLIGFTSPEAARRMTEAAPRVDGAVLDTLQEGAVVAVLATLPRNPLRLFTRKSGLKDLVRIQRILEALLPHGPLLATRPGTRADRPEIRTVLRAEQDNLLEALRAFGTDVQYQITVLWDGTAVLTNAAADETLRTAVAAAAGGDADGRAAMLTHLRTLRDGLQAQLRDLIAPVVIESQILPLDGEEMVANLTVRIRRGGETALEEALASLDALLPGNSRIRLIGPLPALSFAAVNLEHIDTATIDEARTLLGVRDTATLAELRAAYYRFAQDHHPDLNAAADGADLMAAASRAYKLLKRVASGAGHDENRTFLEIVRPGNSTLRRAA